ncbi:MAG: methylenetetrahydrofolate reductase [NAD(P)H] [Pirellulaceae bacterium]
MSLKSVFSPGRLGLSYELFPPKTAKGEAMMYEHVDELVKFSPDFITCTYGAGGSTRDKTLEIVSELKRRYDLPVASHLTLVGSSQDDLRHYLGAAQNAQVDYIVALRGDPPQGRTTFERAKGGLSYANELVDLIRSEFNDFGVLVAGYPETHREATSPSDDLDNLKRKVDAGADAIVTQLFYDNDDFFRFRDACEQRGIRVPIVPGVLPVTSLTQIEKITWLCGSKLPQALAESLKQSEQAEDQFEAGVDWAIAQVEGLVASGIPGLHFYVLNQSPATLRILNAIQADSIRGK